MRHSYLKAFEGNPRMRETIGLIYILKCNGLSDAKIASWLNDKGYSPINNGIFDSNAISKLRYHTLSRIPWEEEQTFLDDIRTKHDLFLRGGVGYGKSELNKSIAMASGRRVKNVKLSTFNPVDLSGLPRIPKQPKEDLQSIIHAVTLTHFHNITCKLIEALPGYSSEAWTCLIIELGAEMQKQTEAFFVKSLSGVSVSEKE